jgi:hypothetical protein
MFRWHDQVAADPKAKRQSTALKIVSEIRRLYKPAKAVEIDQRWLAGRLHVTPRGAQKALDWLVRRDHLTVQVRKPLRLPNPYEPKVHAIRTGVRIDSTNRYEPQSGVDANCSSRIRPVRGSPHSRRRGPTAGRRSSCSHADRSEQRPGGDGGRIQSTASTGPAIEPPTLVCLGPADIYAHAAIAEFDIGQIKGDKLEAAEGAGKAEQQMARSQRPFMPMPARAAMATTFSAVAGILRAGGGAGSLWPSGGGGRADEAIT